MRHFGAAKQASRRQDLAMVEDSTQTPGKAAWQDMDSPGYAAEVTVAPTIRFDIS